MIKAICKSGMKCADLAEEMKGQLKIKMVLNTKGGTF